MSEYFKLEYGSGLNLDDNLMILRVEVFPCFGKPQSDWRTGKRVREGGSGRAGSDGGGGGGGSGGEDDGGGDRGG